MQQLFNSTTFSIVILECGVGDGGDHGEKKARNSLFIENNLRAKCAEQKKSTRQHERMLINNIDLKKICAKYLCVSAIRISISIYLLLRFLWGRSSSFYHSSTVWTSGTIYS